MLTRIIRFFRSAPIILCGVVGACFSGEDPIIVRENLGFSFSCQSQPVSTLCTRLSKFIIPENLDLNGRPIRKVALGDITFQINSEPENSLLQIRHLLITFYCQSISGQQLITIEPDQTALQELVIGKPILLPLDEGQLEKIETTLKTNREILIFIGTQLIGENSIALNEISATATVQY